MNDGSTKNEFDAEAIMVKMKGIGKVGYVIPGGAICKVIEDEVVDCGGIELPAEENDVVK